MIDKYDIGLSPSPPPRTSKERRKTLGLGCTSLAKPESHALGVKSFSWVALCPFPAKMPLAGSQSLSATLMPSGVKGFNGLVLRVLRVQG